MKTALIMLRVYESLSDAWLETELTEPITVYGLSVGPHAFCGHHGYIYRIRPQNSRHDLLTY